MYSPERTSFAEAMFRINLRWATRIAEEEAEKLSLKGYHREDAVRDAHEALAAAATRFDSKRSFHRYAHPKVTGAVRDYNRSWVKRLEPLREVAREAAARHREDSVGEARDAFLAAVKRFESERGIPFRRYAHARVAGAVRDYHRRWMKRLESLWDAALEAGELRRPLEHDQARTRGRSL